MMKGLKLRLPMALALVMFFLLVPPHGKTQEDPAKDTWDYVALGDSITTGYGVEEGYASVYKAKIEADTGVRIQLTNLGHNGWTSGDLLHALRNDTTMRRAIRRAEVLTFYIGMNDLRKARIRYKRKTCGGADNQSCLRAATRRLKVNWHAISWTISELRSNEDAVIRTMDLYNPYVGTDRSSDTWKNDGGLNDYRVYKRYLGSVNRYIAKRSTDYGVPYGKAYRVYNGLRGGLDPTAKGYLMDRVHPNEKGHDVLARRLQKTGYAPLK